MVHVKWAKCFRAAPCPALMISWLNGKTVFHILMNWLFWCLNTSDHCQFEVIKLTHAQTQPYQILVIILNVMMISQKSIVLYH